jgi:hypothetical protein
LDITDPQKDSQTAAVLTRATCLPRADKGHLYQESN